MLYNIALYAIGASIFFAIVACVLLGWIVL